jgi:hypothetical protein
MNGFWKFVTEDKFLWGFLAGYLLHMLIYYGPDFYDLWYRSTGN